MGTPPRGPGCAPDAVCRLSKAGAQFSVVRLLRAQFSKTQVVSFDLSPSEAWQPEVTFQGGEPQRKARGVRSVSCLHRFASAGPVAT